MKIEVTQDDIVHGRQQCAGWCPIALAIRRQLPQLRKVSVFTWEIHIDMGGGEILVASMPVEATEFVKAFDSERAGKRDENPTPFTFTTTFEGGGE